ncbi:hypothetical protein J6590_042815 [Homalodisca vitripennis]|nr:hypothetical protein J6590_042815 [Homalodisca vitripennis]
MTRVIGIAQDIPHASRVDFRFLVVLSAERLTDAPGPPLTPSPVCTFLPAKHSPCYQRNVSFLARLSLAVEVDLLLKDDQFHSDSQSSIFIDK